MQISKVQQRMTMQMDRVSFSYGKQQILHAVSAQIPRGAYTSLIGPNGSGKTTLLSIACGFVKPDAGTIAFGGMDVHKMRMRARAQAFAVVQQREAVAMPFTGLEVVLMGFHPHRAQFDGLSKADYERAEQLMRETGTAQFMDKPMIKLSGGEFQRVILTRALAQNPQLLFLDEAMSDLDISARMELLNLIKGVIRRTGLTVLAVHHDINTAYMFSDNIVALKGGEVYASGAPQEMMTESTLHEIFGDRTEILPGRGILFQNAQDR